MSFRPSAGRDHEAEHRRWRNQLADLFDGKLTRLMLPVAVGALAATTAVPEDTTAVTGQAPVWVSPSTLASMVVGTCQQLVATDAVSFSAVGLPAGLTLSAGGLLCASTPGTYGPFTVNAVNAYGSSPRALSVTVTAVSLFPPVWVTTTIDPMAVGVLFCQALIATGATSYAHTGGTLPPGLCLDTSGLLVFCPTTAGPYTFEVTATNADGSTPQSFTATVTDGLPVWSTTTLGTITRTVPYSLQLVASGATSYAIASGTLPAGLSMTSGGLISGTPSTVGGYGPVVINAIGPGGTVPRSFSGTVLAPAGPTWITTSPLDNTVTDAIHCTAFEATGVGIVTYSVVSGTIPTGLCFDASGLMTFCPTTPGTFNFTVEATDNNGTTPRPFQITVDAPAPLPPAWPSTPTQTLWVSGDSTTDGYATPNTDAYYPLLTTPAWSSARGGAFLAQPLGRPVETYAGWTSTSLGGLIPDYVYANTATYGPPVRVVVMGGTNDLYAAAADGTLSGLLSRMQIAASVYDSWLTTNGIAHLWVTAPPLWVGATNQAAMNAVRNAYNSWLMTVLAPTNHVDTTSLANPNGSWQAAYDLGDGIHPNSTGRTALAMLIQAAL